MDNHILAICGAAALVAFIHVIAGPDHYIPSIVLAKANKWSAKRTALISIFCGVGHILSSVVVGLIAVAIGISLGALEHIESIRGGVAAYLLIGFGLAYAIWGIRYAIKSKPHMHLHLHPEGFEHSHGHTHFGEHAHAHQERNKRLFWIMFIIFVFGVCEPLIPLVMVPAIEQNWWGVLAVALVFGSITVATMTTIIVLSYKGLEPVRLGFMERYSHLGAGSIIAMLGFAVRFFGL